MIYHGMQYIRNHKKFNVTGHECKNTQIDYVGLQQYYTIYSFTQGFRYISASTVILYCDDQQAPPQRRSVHRRSILCHSAQPPPDCLVLVDTMYMYILDNYTLYVIQAACLCLSQTGFEFQIVQIVTKNFFLGHVKIRHVVKSSKNLNSFLTMYSNF